MAIMSKTEVRSMVQKAIISYGFDTNRIMAQIEIESSFNSDAYRAEPRLNDASIGLMQILKGTAVSMGFGADTLTDPQTNINCGCKYMHYILKGIQKVTPGLSYDDQYRLTLISYNSGPTRVLNYIKEVGSNMNNIMNKIYNFKDWPEGQGPKYADKILGSKSFPSTAGTDVGRSFVLDVSYSTLS